MSNQSNQPWIRKYCPKNIKEVQGHNRVIAELKSYILNYKSQKKKAAMLYGGPGVGKTCIVHALANELGYEILEVNASDFRNKDAIKSVVGSASQQQPLFFSKGKIILVDEVDGITGRKDRGGVSALKEVVANSKFPIVMTANDPWNKKFSTLRKISEMMQLRTPSYLSVSAMLKKICEIENIKYEDDSLKRLARRSGGDFRASINDLQNLSQGGAIKKEDLDKLSERNQVESMNSALIKIFKNTNLKIALEALRDVNEDMNTSILWIDENIPMEYKDPRDLYKAYDSLSKADVFRGRIRRWQHWRFLVYVNALISGGIAISKEEKYPGFVSYKPTKRILKYWLAKRANQKRDSIAEKVAAGTHSSKRDVIQKTIPYLKVIFKKNFSFLEQLLEYLSFVEFVSVPCPVCTQYVFPYQQS